MADTKVSNLTAYTTPQSTDVLPIVDIANSITKKITYANLLAVITPTTINTLSVGLGGGALYNNTVVGLAALAGINTGNGNNVAIGPEALKINTSGYDNVAVGRAAMIANLTGIQNTAFGSFALWTSLGSTNTGIGYAALFSTTGSGNVAIGNFAGGYETGSNAFYVDNQNRTDTAGDKAKALLYGVFAAAAASQTLMVNAVLSTSVTGNAAGNVLTTNATQTLTGKRVTKRTGTATSSATPTINTDNVDFYSLTAQAADITSFTTNLSGTPTEGQTLWLAITGTAARAITWGTSFEASTIALPTTTVTTNRLDVGFVWNTTTSKWRCVATC